MKALKLSLFASAMLLGSFTMTAQSADEVMGKHITAVGGADAWKKVNSIKKTGTITIQGMEGKYIVTQVNNKGYRMDLNFDIQGTAINNWMFVTPTEGYMFFPAQGQSEPQAFPAEQVKEMAADLGLNDDVVALKAKGTKVEYVGKEKLDGADVHKLKYDDEGTPVIMYFDATTGYLVKKTSTVEAQGQKMELSETFKDYKKTPEGIAVAMAGNDPQMGDYTFTTVEVNKPVDDATFKK